MPRTLIKSPLAHCFIPFLTIIIGPLIQYGVWLVYVALQLALPDFPFVIKVPCDSG